MLQTTLTEEELVRLIVRVFQPRPSDSGLAIMVDLPDQKAPDTDEWAARRKLAADWAGELSGRRDELGFRVQLVFYRNSGSNNSDLPEDAFIATGGETPQAAGDLEHCQRIPFTQLFRENSMLIALTEYSATAPLKLLAKQFGFRAATMGGFCPAMIPALRLDYKEVNRRVLHLKSLLDRAAEAQLSFRTVSGGVHRLFLDLRHRQAHASGGLIPEAGVAGNLPSGESYIVPYEGELDGDPSRSEGELPVQFGDEIVVYEVRSNRAIAVSGQGTAAARERGFLLREPAYGNIAELGLGVLHDMGIQPCGSILLDEKLGLHLAFGRSDHFGGEVGAAHFSDPAAVVHIDRVYIPATQPSIRADLDLVEQDGTKLSLMRDGAYVIEL